jgi:8-oxo-dGTP diphosphatase
MKTFKQFNTDNWIGPVKILNIKNDLVYTNLGNYINISNNKLIIDYSYILKINNNEIIDTGMSCVDLCILVKSKNSYKILLIKRGKQPFINHYALPGGNIDENEQPIDAAVRELKEETNLIINTRELKYVGYFDKPWRDSRNKNCISHAFFVILDNTPQTKAGDDATECIWIDINNINIDLDIAFDHIDIINKVKKLIV